MEIELISKIIKEPYAVVFIIILSLIVSSGLFIISWVLIQHNALEYRSNIRDNKSVKPTIFSFFFKRLESKRNEKYRKIFNQRLLEYSKKI